MQLRGQYMQTLQSRDLTRATNWANENFAPFAPTSGGLPGDRADLHSAPWRAR